MTAHEPDRADRKLGTQPIPLVVDCAVVDDPSYQPVNEEHFGHTWPAPQQAVIRADLTFVETANDGAVFSVR